jgi:hypothetical protein
MTGDDCHGRVECHHLITSSIKHLKHHAMNGILLCNHHHQHSESAPHVSPDRFRAWLKEKHPDLWDWYNANKWTVAVPNYKEVYEQYSSIRENQD